MPARVIFAEAVANAFLAGDWSVPAMIERVRATFGSVSPWSRTAAWRAHRQFPTPPLDRRDELTRFLLQPRSTASPSRGGAPRPLVRHWWIYEPAMGPRRWDVPAIETLGALRDWLHLETADLDWLADRRGLERFARDERLRNYRYRWVEKRRGGWRLLEIPKAQVKTIQRRILHEILDRIPPHEAAHGFRRARSVVSFAALHTGRRLVVRLDLQDFFTTITIARLLGVFRVAGYPEEVARALAALCTNRTSRAVTRAVPVDELSRRRLWSPHLPQGAPTSPALANLCAFGLDVRLSALAGSMEGRYSRYADDLAFSFDRSLDSERFLALVAGIITEEGFAVNFRKIHFQSRSVRQTIAGVVVNAGPNLERREVDRLKAILHNCRKHGPSTQDRDGRGHLRERMLGTLAWVSMVNPDRAAKLRLIFDAIDWST